MAKKFKKGKKIKSQINVVPQIMEFTNLLYPRYASFEDEIRHLDYKLGPNVYNRAR